MGRSQVKYRTTHGRGRGRGGGGAEAGASRTRGAAAGGGGGGRRPLESNAFRYQEEQEDDDAEEHASTAAEQQPHFFRRQFFAGEENVREPSAAASGSYFQSQTVKQWEADDDVDDPSASSSIGVLDLHWLAEQFAMVEPHIRYQMDPKYCVDFEFEPTKTAADDGEEAKGGNVRDTSKDKPNEDAVGAVPTPLSKSNDPPAAAKTSADHELDALLQLSSS
uniref:Uncharacterized protein n=1 Tax=Globisporangium ultimum (strain ATCC 200006 / CBS 805.95 / DAOM BR144) TaxID=431595 RepID=K3WL90_GLOUD